MRHRSRGIALLSALGILLVVTLLATAAILWITGRDAASHSARGSAVSELLVASQRLPRLATEAVGGSREAVSRLESDVPLAAATDGLGASAADAARQLAEAAGRVVANAAAVNAGQSAAEAVRRIAPELAAGVDAVAEGLRPSVAGEAAAAAQRAARDVVAAADALVTAIGDPQATLRRLEEAESLLGRVVLGLLGRDDSLGLTAVPRGARNDDLAALESNFGIFQERVRALEDAAGGMAEAQAAAADTRRAGDRLYAALDKGAAQRPAAAGVLAIPRLPFGLAVTALVLSMLLVGAHLRGEGTRRNAEQHARQNERNQQAILRLLDELGSLADGDLTVHATVTEDITGAIADSINYAIEALRELVATINDTAIKVEGAAKQTQATASHLASASETQSKQVGDATESVARMAASVEAVSGDAERCSDVARHSVDVAHKGGDAVRRTIEGMNAIRETIQDTSKRIKRLGESSQEIGNIVELINDIAEQTNILALNASIQASMAGESGRGFAVVADEVQRLAERAANATRQIEVLVKTIQSDTNEAVISMERSTTDVVGGALLAENAGAALDEIESVSNQIANLVQNISRTARDQARAAGDITRNMNVLREVSAQTAEATGATSASIGKLAELAAQLRNSAAGFRLPDAPVPARSAGKKAGAGQA